MKLHLLSVEIKAGNRVSATTVRRFVEDALVSEVGYRRPSVIAEREDIKVRTVTNVKIEPHKGR